MVSSGDWPLIVSMDSWFSWNLGGTTTIVRDGSPAQWICSTTLMDVRNKYKARCKRLIFE
jgi:hypothetical protein